MPRCAHLGSDTAVTGTMAYVTEADDGWAVLQDAMQAAAARIRPARRRLSDQQAETIVIEEFSAREIDIYTSAAISIARNLRHPFWPFLHPIRARREGWNWRRGKKRAREGPGVSLEELIARDARFIKEYESLAIRLRGVSEHEAREAVRRLLRETNQQLSDAEVELFTLGVVDPGWAEKDPQRAERLTQQLGTEAVQQERDWEPPDQA